MITNSYKNKVSKLVNQAKEKGLIKTYSEFCESKTSTQTSINESEEQYYCYTDEENNKQYSIGDIVFVSNYKYKNGNDGRKHIFVIIDYGQAVDINYFGFLLSSQLTKATYQYNEIINKNSLNNLYKDSIVKCDDLITLSENEIQFKIGEVTQEDLERFISTYEKYLSES